MQGTDLQFKAAASPGLNLTLAADMRADAAVRVIMQRLLEMMNANEAGVHAGEDAEFLHNFRIAVRRYRTLLGQIRGVIPQRSVLRFSSGFVWLGEITRPARDLDVYLPDFEDYRRSLAPAVRQDIEPLHAYLQHQQQLAHQQLVSGLKSNRYAQLISALTAYLATPLPIHSKLPQAMLPVSVLAEKRIRRALRRVVSQGGAIDAGSPPPALHALRKSCKKLRYLMEFFQSLYPAAAIKKAIKILKSLQDILGEYQDLQVQQGFLAAFRQQTTAATPAMGRLLAATDVMMRKLEKRQLKVRKKFKQRFDGFMEAKHQKVYRELFARGKAIGPRKARKKSN